MIMELDLEEMDTNTTRIRLIHENIPQGVTPQENKAGVKQSLAKLKHYLRTP